MSENTKFELTDMSPGQELSSESLRELKFALDLLDSPGLIARISDMLGSPIEAIIARLPEGASHMIDLASRKALGSALKLAVGTLRKRSGKPTAKNRLHTTLSGLSGAAGGAFGLMALGMELPFTTTIIMRSIGDIARSEGEDLSNPKTQMACMEVFAFGGTSNSDDAAESGYFAVRAALARSISEAAQYVGKRGVLGEGAPVLVRFLAKIASRFNTVVSEKVLAQGIPIIGAIGGATINILFIRHFQDMARGHFIIRRLERIYGGDRIRIEAGKIR